MIQLTEQELGILISMTEDNMSRVDEMKDSIIKDILNEGYNNIHEKLWNMKKELR